MVIYVDVLLFINTVINYAILLTVDRLLKRGIRLYRLLLGSFTGSLFALSIFLDLHSGLLLSAVKIMSAFAITLTTFGCKNKTEFFKALILTVAVSTLFCGMMILFYQVFRPPNMMIINDVVYLQLNPLIMICLTVIIYVLLLLLYKLFFERIKSTIVHLCFTVQGNSYACMAKVDTGCNLCEPFSSSPVIIADSTVFTIGKDAPARIIPYTTVNGSSYLYAVKADTVIIDKRVINKSVYIAATDQLNHNFHAIINSEIVR